MLEGCSFLTSNFSLRTLLWRLHRAWQLAECNSEPCRPISLRPARDSLPLREHASEQIVATESRRRAAVVRSRPFVCVLALRYSSKLTAATYCDRATSSLFRARQPELAVP